jgi:hypothetical protein
MELGLKIGKSWMRNHHGGRYYSKKSTLLSHQKKMVLDLVLGARQTAAEQAIFFTWDHLRFLGAVDDLEIAKCGRL